MKPKNTIFVQGFTFALCYGILFYILQFFLAQTAIFSIIPSAENIHTWDVGFYENIKRLGYVGDSDNPGFFILFPLIWRLSHLGIWGICVLNTLFFAVGFGVLMQTIQEKGKVFWLLCLTIPSVYFVFIPYTESLFFLLSAVLFYGILKKRFWLFWIALLLISLVRATAIFLLPALLAMEILSNPKEEVLKSIWRFVYKSAFPSLLGLDIFILFQYYETGIWFAYFKTQSTTWGHVFTWTTMPFTNIAGSMQRYHWLSALAIFLDFSALLLLLKYFWKWFKSKQLFEPNLIFSLGYLTMVLFSLMFMNPKYGSLSTNIMGANRYTFATPFFLYFLYFLFQRKFNLKQIGYIVIFLNIFLFGAFNAFKTLNVFIEVGLMANLLIVSFLFYTQDKFKYQWLLIAVIAFDFFIQLHLFQQFITPLYMD